MGYASRSGRRGGGPPAWLIFLVAIALVFGAYYLLRGAQDFFRTGGLGVEEATGQAQLRESATAVRVTRMATNNVGAQLLPSGTPVPACIDFRVAVPNAIVRSEPSASGGVLTGFSQGELVCVISRAEGNRDWYLIDQNPETRRIEAAYMNEEVIEAVNPTATPTRTVTALPTVTPGPTSENPTATVVPSRTRTQPPDFRSTQPLNPNYSPTPSATRHPVQTAPPADE